MTKKDLFIGLIIIVISFISMLLIKEIIYLDYYVLSYFRFQDIEMVNIFKLISLLGSQYILIPLSLIILIFFKKVLPLINLTIVFLLSTILKLIIQRPRPISALVDESTFSFPSGHTLVSFAFYGLLIYLICTSKISKLLKIILTILLSIIIISISFSRIYLEVHYLSDVLGGLFIGFIYLYIFITFVNLKRSK